jgi:hypothetical protein
VKLIIETAERESAGDLVGQSPQCPGVYVITFPHYWNHPCDRASGRTLVKVGFSKDVYKRFNSMAPKTACPEPWLVVRVYRSKKGDAQQMETKFHEHLVSAGHLSPHHDSPETGCEWFLTDLDFLDGIARKLGLSVFDWHRRSAKLLTSG